MKKAEKPLTLSLSGGSYGEENIRFNYGGGSCVYCFCRMHGAKDTDTAKENITTTKKVTDDSNFKLSYTQADSLDPFKSKRKQSGAFISCFESLFDIDENWESVPNIATKYEFSDGKTLKVSFNPSLTFSDGSPIESDDIIYSFNAAKNRRHIKTV